MMNTAMILLAVAMLCDIALFVLLWRSRNENNRLRRKNSQLEYLLDEYWHTAHLDATQLRIKAMLLDFHQVPYDSRKEAADETAEQILRAVFDR